MLLGGLVEIILDVGDKGQQSLPCVFEVVLLLVDVRILPVHSLLKSAHRIHEGLDLLAEVFAVATVGLFFVGTRLVTVDVNTLI